MSFVLAIVMLAGQVGTPMYSGDANYANESHGSDYLAMRLPRGTIVNICGQGGCWDNARVNDFGPVESTGDIADIALVRFAHICGYTLDEARIRGECPIVVEELGIPLPPTDTSRDLAYWLSIVR